MKRIAASLILVIFFISASYSQDKNPGSSPGIEKAGDNVEQTAGGEMSYSAEYWLFGSVPTVVLIWGLTVWKWGSAPKWQIKTDGWGIEQDSYTGGADKVSHTWGIYTISRFGSWAFEKNGDSRGWAIFKGFLYGQFVGLGIEAGDGFGKTYGFSCGDMTWNFAGGIMQLLFDLYPPLDNLIGFQFEYWPSKDYMARKDKWGEFTSDVSGQKFILAWKMSGMPYIGETFLKYFQIDFGYYTRGYWYNPSHWDYKSRHAYIGFAFNLSSICDSVFPEGNWRASTSRFFKYYHAPIAYNPDALDYTLPDKEKIIQNR